MKRRWSNLAWVTLAALCALVPGQRAKAQSPRPEGAAPVVAQADPLAGAGVVDLEAILRKHPDAQQLQAIDQQIASLEADLAAAPGADIDPAMVKKRLEQVQKGLVDEFKAEVEGTQARLNGRKASVEGTLRAEAEQMRHELESYALSLKKQAGGGAAESGAAPRSLDAGGQQKLSNLMLASQVTVAQRRRELEHKIETSLAAEKRVLESESTRRLAEVMQANQAEKLQIQLDLQTASEEADRKKLQDRLIALGAAEDKKRESVRTELAARFDQVRAKETAKAEAELRTYKDKLERDVRRQVGQQIGRPEGKEGATAPPPSIARLQGLLSARQAQAKARFEARKDALMGQLKAESEAAQAALKKRQAGLSDRMKQEQKRIIADIVKKSQKVSGDELKRRKHMASELEDLRKQRERVYGNLLDQVRSQLKPLADAQHVPVVLCGVRVNIGCKDLTDAAIQTISKR